MNLGLLFAHMIVALKTTTIRTDKYIVVVLCKDIYTDFDQMHVDIVLVQDKNMTAGPEYY